MARALEQAGPGRQAALRRSIRDQGQYRPRRPSDDGGLSRLRLHARQVGDGRARLIEAGAIPIGKTNLDQFATGLNGTRSPYGAPASALNADYISGGSSSGSAVAVAAGLVSFSLGTDTAGSGRVPAQFNNLVGLKPTRGLLSTSGVVPACRSLDCVSIFALCADDARDVLAVAKGFDAGDPFSRDESPDASAVASVRGTRFGVPRREDLQFFGNDEGERLFDETLRAHRRAWAAKSSKSICVRSSKPRGYSTRAPGSPNAMSRFATSSTSIRKRCIRSRDRSSPAARGRPPPTPLPPTID